MLRQLHISNLAVIEKATMDFAPGLNVFTGQTGAGKSLLIGAIEFLLGLRGGGEQAVSMIRTGASEARVTGFFEIASKELLADVEAILDRPVDEGELLITRRLFITGRSSISINGEPATAPMLRTLGQRLIDIHGQYDQQYLLKPSNQRMVLDAFANCAAAREAFGETYRAWQSLKQRRDELADNQAARAARLELLNFQADEIDAAELEPGEFAETQQRFVKLSNAGALLQQAGELTTLLNESDDAICDRLEYLAKELDSLAKLDPAGIDPLKSTFLDAQSMLDDLARDLGRYVDSVDVDEERLAETQARLDQLNGLISKYAPTPTEDPIQAVLDVRAAMAEELEALRSDSTDFAEMDATITQLAEQLAKQGSKLSARRSKAAAQIAPKIEAQLAELGMAEATFETRVTAMQPDDPAVGPSGLDTVEFLVCTNPGLGTEPLRHIASGGEISRIMLAIKSILAAGDAVPVLVFDEIDANIGGRLGSVIGQTFRKLVRTGGHQILCITHLAQIAAYGENHLRIAKQTDGNETQAEVTPVLGDARVAELAEMLAGDAATKTTLAQVREMLAEAK